MCSQDGFLLSVLIKHVFTDTEQTQKNVPGTDYIASIQIYNFFKADGKYVTWNIKINVWIKQI